MVNQNNAYKLESIKNKLKNTYFIQKETDQNIK